MSDSEDNEEQAPLQQAAESEESRRAPAVEMNVSAFLSPIQTFLATPGDPPLPWKIWKQQFSTYLLATGLNTAPKEQQLAILLDSLGTEGQRIFATLPGKSNNVADTLSRLVPQDDVTEKSYFDEEEDELFIQQTFIDELQAAITPEELARETLQGPVLKEVLCYMKTGWEGPPRDILLSPFYMVREELFSWNMSCIGRGDRTIVPTTLRHRVLTQAHVGHPGTRKMKQFLRSKVWWPKMDDDVTTFVNNCVPCALSEKSLVPETPPLQPTPWPNGPWEKIQVDIFGELQAAPAHQKYLIVVTDLYSKWPEVIATSNVTTATVITGLSDLFTRWGQPQVMAHNSKLTSPAIWRRKESATRRHHCTIR
ncbi:hypothetical protein AAFF_G00354840 [Aldrovandia affinis]|uniref:Gypsy retrotransposon integrase-like protein 1 n=1 Tax=Aldrovandia affinis TaxID=143900 RepID=A0AAD7SJJ0_9TELE|nr:hypothetical protein AAFF_G00354840 [Aldrovandia affinis]